MTPATIHSVTNPGAIRAQNRQTRNRKREVSPERKAAVKAWCVGKLCSCGCGKPANCAHHPSDDLYQDEWANLDECEPYNSRCHHLHHKGLERCPSCGGWMKAGAETCFNCLPSLEKDFIAKCRDARNLFIRTMRDQDNAFRRGVYRQRHPLKAVA